MTKYGKVIIDIASSLVDKVFDYALNDDIPVGSRVLVPFGNQIKDGYLIDVVDDVSYDKTKIKSIIKPLENFAVIKPDQFKMAEFLKKKYNIGMCDSIRLFLPSEMRSGKVKDLFIKNAYLF